MKRTSKGLALLLALTLLISMNPAIVFSEDVASSKPAAAAEETVTPEDVHEALGDAVKSELNAAKELSPAPDSLNEVGAAVNEVSAGYALKKAEEAVAEGDAKIEEAAQSAENNRDLAKGEAEAAGADADAAELAAGDAEEALKDAVNSKTKAEAVKAADAAKEASVQAQKAASDAVEHAKNAADAADRAKSDYEAAQAAYDEAKAKSDELLAKGLIDAQQAADMTAATAERVNAAYNIMVTAQQAAAQAAEDAAEKAADADALLDQQVKALDQIIVSTASDVTQKTGTAVLTGSALAAAKIVAESTKHIITYSDSARIDIRSETPVELGAKIKTARTKIEASLAVINVKKAALNEKEQDYEDKKAELEQAKADLEFARDIVKNADAINKEREESGIKDSLESVRSNPDYTQDEVAAVAGYLMGSDETIEWDDPEENIFVLDGKFYKVSIENVEDPDTGSVTDRIVRVNEYVPSQDKEVRTLPAARKNWSEDGTTGIKAYEGENDPYEVTVERTRGLLGYNYDYQINVDGKQYDLKHSPLGRGYYYTDKGVRHYVTITVPTEAEYGDETANSSEIAKKWDAAENAEGNYHAAQIAVVGATKAKICAEAALEKARLGYVASGGALNPRNLEVVATLEIGPRERVIDKIVDCLKGAHHDAVDDLGDSVKDGAKNISAATADVAKASVASVAAHAAADVTDALSKAADKLAAEAREKKDAADKAAADAAEALEKYQALMETYGPDYSKVERAKEAYEAAQEYADAAAMDADRAQEAAMDAQSDYEAAQEIADKKVDPEPKPDPKPTPKPTPKPHKPSVPDNTTGPIKAYSGNPKTGDENGLAESAALFIFSVTCLTAMMYSRRKRDLEEEMSDPDAA